MRLCPQSFRLHLKKHSAKTKFPLFSYLISFLSKSWCKESRVVRAHVDLPCRWRLVLCLCRGCHRIQSIYSATQVNFRNRKQSKPALQFKAPVQPGAPETNRGGVLRIFFLFFFYLCAVSLSASSPLSLSILASCGRSSVSRTLDFLSMTRSRYSRKLYNYRKVVTWPRCRPGEVRPSLFMTMIYSR